MFVNLNGKYLSTEKAGISIDNRSFRYGDGFFETIKVINEKVNLIHLHLDRLFYSIQALAFKPPHFFTEDYIVKLINELVIKNNHSKLARVRLTIFRGNGGLYDAESNQFNFLIQSWPLNTSTNNLNDNGLIVGIYPKAFKAADFLSNIKNNNYLLYVMAAFHAKEMHWNDALVLNNNQSLADSTIANLFIIKEKKIITPPLGDGPVNGVMRRYILGSVVSLGYQIEERSVYENDLKQADECFLTNAIQGIKWVGKLENNIYSRKHIMTIYKEIIAPLWNQN